MWNSENHIVSQIKTVDTPSSNLEVEHIFTDLATKIAEVEASSEVSQVLSHYKELVLDLIDQVELN